MKLRFTIALLLVAQLCAAQFLQSTLPLYKYETEYQALITFAKANAFSPMPSIATRIDGNRLMQRLKSDGLHAAHDAYWVTATDSREFASLNWKNPSTFRLLENGTLSHSSLGFQGNGSTGYLNTQFNASTNGVNYTLNDAGVTVHVSSFDATSNNALFGVRNAGATSQILGVARSTAVLNATRMQMNDNTNSDFADNFMTRAIYHFKRVNASNKGLTRKSEVLGNVANNAVSIPNGNIYLLARNSLSTTSVDLYSANTIGFAGISRELTTSEENLFRNSYVTYFLRRQEPIFDVRSVFDVTDTDEQINLLYQNGGVGTWDEGSVFGEAVYDDGAGTRFGLYGGTDDTSTDPQDYSVGAFDYSSPLAGTKDASNPLINIASLSPWTAIFPMDCLVVGSTIYWFASNRDGSGNHNTIAWTSTTSAPKTFTTPVQIITAGSTAHFNHGFHIIRNHPDTDYWYAVYAHRNSSASQLRINVIRCLRANDLLDDANWGIVHTDIVDVPTEIASSVNVGQVYPFCYYDATESNYKLLYGRFVDEKAKDAFTIFSTESSDLSSFPEGIETLSPTGSATTDGGYTSLPTLDFVNNLIYYSGREGGAESAYKSRLVKQYTVQNFMIPIIPPFSVWRRRRKNDDENLKQAA